LRASSICSSICALSSSEACRRRRRSRFRARALHDLEDAALDIDAALDDAEHLVARAEHALEQVELEVEKLVNALLGVVLEIEEVDDGHVDLLAVAVAAPDALLDALRVPGQVEIDDQRAELKVDAFRAGLRSDQDGSCGRGTLRRRRPSCPPSSSRRRRPSLCGAPASPERSPCSAGRCSAR
jgi:hypothetical protein